MPTLRVLPEFTDWLGDLRDRQVRGVILARVKWLQLGLAGDVSPVGGGVSELRIHVGAGWRVYFTQRGGEIVILLLGGSKKTQAGDIRRAKQLADRLD